MHEYLWNGHTIRPTYQYWNYITTSLVSKIGVEPNWFLTIRGGTGTQPELDPRFEVCHTLPRTLGSETQLLQLVKIQSFPEVVDQTNCKQICNRFNNKIVWKLFVHDNITARYWVILPIQSWAKPVIPDPILNSWTVPALLTMFQEIFMKN